MSAAEAAHPDQRVAVWFMDEARVGQKGRLCHRWWRRGQRPPGYRDKRFASAYLFAAVAPATGAGVALVLPEATAVAMNLFLAEFAAGLPEGVHAVLALDRAGWHGAKALEVPANVTLVHLPPYAPQLNPVERVWLYLRERCLSLRVFNDYRAIVDACCAAWNRLAADPDRLRSLCDQPWIRKVTSSARRYHWSARWSRPHRWPLVWPRISWCGQQPVARLRDPQRLQLGQSGRPVTTAHSRATKPPWAS